MTTEKPGEPWPGITYGGFTGARPRARDEAGPDLVASRSRMSKRGVIGGVAAALMAGVLFGVFARPDLDRSERLAMRDSTAAEAAARPVPIEVAPVTPVPLPKPAGKLEVLPRDMASAAVIPPPPPALPAERAAPRPNPPQAQAAAADPEPAAVAARQPAPEPIPVAAAPAGPGFSCRAARTPAERMICADPGLARLDRRLNAAFRMAVDSGIPYRELRADQDDWLDIREDAAAYSRGAVANIYRQRIAELEEMAGR